MGQTLVVKRSFFTLLENKTGWLHNNIFQSTCTVGGRKNILLPNKGSVKAVGDRANLLTRTKFETEMEESGTVYVLVCKLVDTGQEVPHRIRPLLEEFQEVFPEELPDGVPFHGDNCNDETPPNSKANFSQHGGNDEVQKEKEFMVKWDQSESA